MNDSLGDRMKMYESAETSRKFLPLLPTIIRLDGKSFHAFTRGLERPYDAGLSTLMQEVTRQLVAYTSARIGYTQSDEITLVLYSDNVDSQCFFDGSVFKTISVLAGYTSALFNNLVPKLLPKKTDEIAVFDCRAWNVPTQTEAVNCLIWRELDATRNSVSMAAQTYFPHKQLQGKSSSDKHELLHSIGINWNDYPAFFKRGVYFQRRKVMREFTATEIEMLPPLHNARENPNLKIERTDIVEIDIQLAKVANRIGVVFYGECPAFEN